MTHSENLVEELNIAKAANRLRKESYKIFYSTTEDEEPEIYGLTFNQALEIIKMQQLIKKLDEIKSTFEKLNG